MNYTTLLTAIQSKLDRAKASLIAEAIDAEQERYDDALALTAQLQQDGEISQEEAQRRLFALAVAIILIAFLDGRVGGDRELLTPEQEALILGAMALLSEPLLRKRSNMTQAERTRITRTINTITGSQLEAALPVSEVQELDEALQIHENSSIGLAQAIDAERDGVVNGVVGIVAGAVAAVRIPLWIGKLGAYQSIGRMYDPRNPDLTWRRGPTESPCSDCLLYDGQTRTAREWRDLKRSTGHYPRSPQLSCRGYNCQCTLS